MRVLVVLLFTSVALAMHTKTYIKQSGMADLQSSASGYSYQSNQPISYIQFSPQPLAQPILQPFQPINYLKHPIPYIQQPVKLNNLELQEEGDKQEDKEEEKESYEKGEGSEYNSDEKSSKGASGEKGYESKHGYEKGEKGHYAKEGEQGNYAENGGNKKSHHDTAQHYAAQHNQGSGSNGGSFSVSDSHKKGHKTTGFHKVYHKDEYKKDHTFYDESDKKGHYSRYGSGHAAHAAVKGGFEKGGNSEAGYQNNDYGKKGFHDKGRFENAAAGHKQAAGNENYHSSQSQYANKQGKEDGKQYGFSLQK